MGTQPSSLEHMKRFSMANCITIGMPDCYTAQAMSVDCFLKRCQAGQTMEMPYKEVWPDYTFPRIFKIPATIETFLFSSYCEMLSQSYIFPKIHDGVRYTLGYSGEIKEIKPYVERVAKIAPQKLADDLAILDQKITSMWGSNITKIIVTYDCTRGLPRDKISSKEYDDATIAALVPLGWYVAPIIPEPGEPLEGQPGWSAWSHYTRPTINKFYASIEKIEQERNKS